MPHSVPPIGTSATYQVLAVGYVRGGVASTVSFVEDGDLRAVVDPGMVAHRSAILDPLARRGIRPGEVTDVVLSHHHPDHTLHAALFPKARVHDHWAIYERDRWTSRPAEGARLAPSVLLLETPGHTPQDVTTLVGTSRGVVAFTHLWWNRNGPTPDPVAVDPRRLLLHRHRVVAVANTIVPGHGAPFRVHPVAGRGRGRIFRVPDR